MATRNHTSEIGLQRSKAAPELGRHAAVRTPHDDIGDGGGDEWLSGNGSNSHRPRPHGRVIGGHWVQVAYALIDVICVLVNGVVAFLVSLSPLHPRRVLISARLAATNPPALRYGGFLLLYCALILLLCQLQDLYRTPRDRPASEEAFAVVKAVSFATLLLTAFVYLSRVEMVSRSAVIVGLLLNVFALAAWRYAKRKIVVHRVEHGIGTRNALIIGAGRVGQALARHLEANKLLGYRFKGFLDENHSNDPRLLGKIEHLSRVARAEFVDDVFITIPSERELVKRIVVEARRSRLNVKVIPELYDGLGWHAPLRQVGDFPVMELNWKPLPTLGLLFKRTFDFALSVCALVACAPLLIVLGVWIKLDSPGPVFYRSRRVGKKGHVFACYKLRTMVTNADELKNRLRHLNERKGPFFKISDDPRITHCGKFLRKYSFDELPQLWNVVKGDMSLVGPRPHPLDDYQKYDLNDLRRLEVQPGITGLWQVTARQDPSFDTSLRLDLDYIENWSLWLDTWILLRTIPAAIEGLGE